MTSIPRNPLKDSPSPLSVLPLSRTLHLSVRRSEMALCDRVVPSGDTGSGKRASPRAASGRTTHARDRDTAAGLEELVRRHLGSANADKRPVEQQVVEDLQHP